MVNLFKKNVVHMMCTFVVAILALSLNNAAAATLNTNLIPNPGGEGRANLAALSADGWNNGGTDRFYYFSTLNGTSPHTGNIFLGFFSNPILNQSYSWNTYHDFDVSGNATAIANGTILVQFSGWTLVSTGGTSYFRIQPLDASGAAIGTSFVKSNTATSWTQYFISQALPTGTRTVRLTIEGDNIKNGFAAFDDLSLMVVSNTDAAPTVSAIADQANVSGDKLGPLAFTVSDVDNATSLLTTTATSSNTTLIPNASIVLTGVGTASQTIAVTSVAGQVGTAAITLAVSDGVKTTYVIFNVTVSPAYQLGVNTVTNGNGSSMVGWSGETSRFFVGTQFQVATLPSGSTTNIVTQDINVGKFAALIDQGWQNYSASCGGSGSCSMQALDQYGSVLVTRSITSITGILPTGTRTVRISMGGPVGATISAINFTLTATGYPRMTQQAQAHRR